MIFNKYFAVIVSAVISSFAYAHGDEDHSNDDQKAKPIAQQSISSETPQRLTDGSIFLAKSLQRQLAIQTQLVQIKDLAAVVEINGTVISDPQSGGLVQAPFAGSIMPGSKGMPVAGRHVSKGEILLYLQAINGAIESANQKSSLAEIEAQLNLANSRVNRLKQLEGAVAQKDIEAAQVEYLSLLQRRDFIKNSIDKMQPLRATASGIISSSQRLVAGQIVDAKQVLFEIIDPKRLAVEALAYDSKLATGILSASALLDDLPLDLQFIGGGRQLREQALPLLFRITSPRAEIAVGQVLKVMLRTPSKIKGAAISRSALSKLSSGEDVVWLHLDAERFVARKVVVQSLDSSNFAVKSGLKSGDRVVVNGAALLSQIR